MIIQLNCTNFSIIQLLVQAITVNAELVPLGFIQPLQ